MRLRYEEQLRTAALAAQRAVQIENARANAQIAALQATFNAQQAIVADWAQKVINYTYAVSNAVNGLLGGKGGVTTKPGTVSGSFAGGGKPVTAVTPVGSGTGSYGFSLSSAPGYLSNGQFAFAKGGRPPVGRDVLVGENGPELARFRSPVDIFSATETKRMGGGGGFSVGTMIFNGRTRRELHREFDKYVTQAMENG